ncbi:DUF998 domain-containing protein [Fibrella aquatica]|uniref:DUF998 domain-containing protein n=1 Tax=Fibrella aquatica TaxID=3242487 RepID=UPI003522891A
MSYLSGFFLLTSLYLLAGILYFSKRRANYNPIRHTISELGEIGALDQRLVNYGVFLPVGVLLMLAGLYTHLKTPAVYPVGLAGLSVSVGIGYVIAAFFPCDVGSPLSGSTRQQIHNLGGSVEYLGGALFLFNVTSQLPDQPFDTVGSIILIGSILLSVRSLFPWRGLIQRFLEIMLFGSLIFLPFRFL